MKSKGEGSDTQKYLGRYYGKIPKANIDNKIHLQAGDKITIIIGRIGNDEPLEHYNGTFKVINKTNDEIKLQCDMVEESTGRNFTDTLIFNNTDNTATYISQTSPIKVNLEKVE